MISIAICDDNAQHLAETARVIRAEAAAHNQHVSVQAFAAPDALLAQYESSADTPAIAVLDIAMQGMDGIQLAKRLNALSPRCQVIFLTGYDSYLMDVYETEHVYYVLKKSLATRIWPAIEKAWQRYAELDNAFFSAATAAGTVICRYSDILYFERIGRKTRVCTKQHALWIRDALRELDLQRFPKQFVRCHQSFLVNLDHVSALEAGVFVLRNNERIPISRAHRQEAQDAFWRYLNASILDR